MKRLVSACFFSLVSCYAMGQYGNEWIRYTQQYLKIPVAREGIFRLSHDVLTQAGLPPSADPRTFRLYHRGKEQAIYVQGETDGVFNDADYVDFYGKGNDGTLDATLYDDPNAQPHTLYNLFSDTTSYFLTWGAETGKRMQHYSGAFDGLSPAPWHIAEQQLILTQRYAPGADYGEVHKTAFDVGEGWTGVQILQNQEVVYTLEGISDGVPAGGKPKLEVLLTGLGPMNHSVQLSSASRVLGTADFHGFDSFKYQTDLEWTDISADGVLSLKVRVTGAEGADRASVGYIRVTFPQAPTMQNISQKTFNVPSSDVATLLRIVDAPTATRLFDVTDPSDVVMMGTQSATDFEGVIPPATFPRKIFASAEVLTAAPIQPVTFRQIDPAASDYVIITHPSLRKPAGGYVDPVKAYAEYRSLPEGGGFDTLVVNIRQLYDQFNYGETSPRAIVQFMKFLAAGKLPDYLFLIGKGLDINYGFHRNPAPFTVYKDLVPTAGYPASDMAFTAGLSGTPGVAAVATGRLTANDPADVAAYLDKVKQRDALPFDNLWRKELLHLSGGIESYEPALFQAIMEGFAPTAEGLYLGGRVQAISKKSAGIKVINIADKVNAGVGLITFFGHSAPNTLDFDIGLVTDPLMGYDNKGKYPFLLMNGCNVGSFFLNANIFGENWIKTPGRGAIGFIAHSAYGQIGALQNYTHTFYEVAFADSTFLHRGVGQVQREVARRFAEAFGISPLTVSQIEQMVLLGDPAIKIFGAEKPDYSIAKDEVSVTAIDDQPITALSDAFNLQIPVRNFGVASDADLRVSVSREFGNGNVIAYDSVFSPVLFQDTLTMVIRNMDAGGFGTNVFRITIDADDAVDELNESNNTIEYNYFIPLGSTRNLYPYNFAIVKTTQVDLSFQHTDPLSGTRKFVLEIDTARTFDSGFKQQFVLEANVLARQRFELLNIDSTVYYWRTRIAAPLESESGDWAVSSFSYLSQGPEGWAQLRFPQYESNTMAGLTQDPELKRIEFRETRSDIAIRTFSAAAGKPADSVSLRINGVEFNLSHEGDGCRNNTLNLVAFDKRSTEPYAGVYFTWHELLYSYGGRRLICGREPYIINSFKPQEMDTGNDDDLLQYIDNVKPGDSIVLFTIGDAGYSQWPAAAKAKLASIGISLVQIDAMNDGDAAVIFAKKGAPPGTARIFRNTGEDLKVNRTIAGRLASGSMGTPLIGPARSWQRFTARTAEVEEGDEVRFSITGIRADGDIDTLKINASANEDLSAISASEYPWLTVRLTAGDEVNLTAPQLAHWLVSYEPVPEGLVFYRGDGVARDVSEGEPVLADFGFVNISNKDYSDSLVVHYDLLNAAGHNGESTASAKIRAPLAGDTTLFSVAFNTVNRTGVNDAEVVVNPGLQRELLYENNRIRLPEYVTVRGDRRHPVLDVTFDGRHIENNDVVAAHPVIAMRLWDENPFIKKTDTLGVRIFFAGPCSDSSCAFERLYLSRGDMTWQAATSASDFIIRFTPKDLADGTYRLRVEAGDARGNGAGDDPYEVAFRIDATGPVVVSSPYPNPFYYHTRFEVVAGNDEVQYSYALQFTDMTGKVVLLSDSEVAMDTGTNFITWDGTDSHGDPLPNGIYLYQLTVMAGDNTYKRYTGKVVLVR